MGWLFEENLAWLVVAAVLGALVTLVLGLARVRDADQAPPKEAEPEPAVDPEPELAVQPEPELAVQPEPQVLVDGGLVGAAEPLADGSAPSRHFSIKGNKGSMKYHTAASPYYRRVRADWWFDSEEAAVSAGFRRWDEKDETPDVPPPAPMPAGAEPEPEATLFDTAEPATEPKREPAADPAHPYGPGSSVPTDGGGSPAPEFGVKGITRSRTFHTGESPWFSRMRADVWFDSEESARAAGFDRWDD